MARAALLSVILASLACLSIARWGSLVLVVVSHISPRLCLFALSVTEAEFYADVLCAQDMLFIMWLLFSLGLDVQHNSQ